MYLTEDSIYTHLRTLLSRVSLKWFFFFFDNISVNRFPSAREVERWPKKGKWSKYSTILLSNIIQSINQKIYFEASFVRISLIYLIYDRNRTHTPLFFIYVRWNSIAPAAVGLYGDELLPRLYPFPALLWGWENHLLGGVTLKMGATPLWVAALGASRFHS